MPIPTPFHEKTFPLCTSLRYKDWAGYYAVCSYDTSHDREYYAFRYAAGLLDVTPLFKYEVRGKDAAAFLSRIMVRNIAKLKLGQVAYCCWCDDHGKVIDDGTVSRLEQDWFRVTAAEPSWAWLQKCARGFQVTIADVTADIAALSLQGPNAREILRKASDADMDGLRFFRLTRARLDGLEVVITRTGYTGDLGYEIWAAGADAPRLWDALMDTGRDYGLQPCGLDALDVTRMEAGFVMNGVDYFSAHHCLIEARKSSPYELGLGWTVNLDREPFIGQAALQQEIRRQPAWGMAGIILDWPDYVRICAAYGLPPQVCSSTWRSGVPVYNSGEHQIGYATSGAWSPILKQNLALATLEADYCRPGTQLLFEMTVEYRRHKVRATVAEMPFYNPERKRS